VCLMQTCPSVPHSQILACPCVHNFIDCFQSYRANIGVILLPAYLTNGIQEVGNIDVLYAT
jgi:hypothetical protein